MFFSVCDINWKFLFAQKVFFRNATCLSLVLETLQSNYSFEFILILWVFI